MCGFLFLFLFCFVFCCCFVFFSEMKEGHVLFRDAFNKFYLQLNGVGKKRTIK